MAAILGFAAGIWQIARAATLRGAVAGGFLFGAAHFAVAMRWLVEPFRVEAAIYGWMAPFALALMAAGLALFWAGAAGVAHRFVPAGPARAFGLAAALVLAEELRGVAFTGLPWALPGQVVETTPLVQIAALAGPHGLSFAVLLVAATLAALPRLSPRGRAVGLAGAGLAVAAGWWWGLAREQGVAADVAPAGPVVRIVQPNAPQALKWDPAHAPRFLATALAQTAAPAGAAGAPVLVVWPEMAITPWLRDAGPVLARIRTAAPEGAEVVLGLRRADGLRVFNSAILLDASGEVAALYDKRHLVPFGEYVPFGNLLSDAGIGGLAAREGYGFSPGAAPVPFATAAGLARVLICYEAVFPGEVLAGLAHRPRLLLQLTNDAWFGDGAGPAQHLALARLRAIETGLPLVRAANTGISAVIDAAGGAVASLPLNRAGHLDAALPAAAPVPLYARLGEWPVVLMAAALLTLLGLATGRDPETD